jgi:hypothetical protein
MRKTVDVVAVVCTLFAGAAVVLATGPFRGWVVLVACGIMGVTLLRHRVATDRGVTTLFGVYVLLTGVTVGLPKVWAPGSAWVAILAEVSFWASLVALLTAAWLLRAGPAAPG